MDAAEPSPPARSGRRWKTVLKWVLTVGVLLFVGRRALSLVRGQDFSALEICPGWLAAAAVLYAVAWLPSVWFWRDLLFATGQPVPWSLALRAYFAGHLGKYVPGKAGVLLIRGGLLKERGFAFGVSTLTAAYETLIMMGIGLVVAIGLAPLLAPKAWLERRSPDLAVLADWRWLPAVAIAAAAVAGLPLVAALLSRVARKMVPGDATELRIRKSRILHGYAAFIVSWWLLGLSLGAVLQSLSNRPFSLSDWPLWTAAASASTVIGFVAIFAPGGIGVREGILIEVLRIQPEISQQDAVMASVLLRIVWFLTEIALALGLGFVFRSAVSAAGAASTAADGDGSVSET